MKNEDSLKTLVPRFYIRSKTNSGDLAKQSFTVVKSKHNEPALVIRKLVLSDDFHLYRDENLLKQFKGKGLFEAWYSIKMSTLNEVLYQINKCNPTKSKK